MMPRTLRWWSDKALAFAASRFSAAWKDWGEGWGLDVAAIAPRNAFERGAGAGHLVWRRHPGDAWLGVRASEPAQEIAKLLFNADALPGSMASEVCQSALEDLGATLSSVVPSALQAAAGGFTPTMGDSASIEAIEPPEDGWRPWSGAIELDLSVQGATLPTFTLHLPTAIASSLLRSIQPTSEPIDLARLTSTTEALGTHRLRMSVELADLRMDLSTLESLQTGDVLTLAHRLDEPLNFRLPRRAAPADSDRTLCRAALGARRGLRAVELFRHPASY